jgi:hypothetical protein
VRQPEWLLSRNLSQRMPLLSRRVDELIEPLQLGVAGVIAGVLSALWADSSHL